MTFSAPLAAALATKDAWVLARITCRDGTVLKIAKADTRTPDGQYLGRVRSFGSYTDEVSDSEGLLVTPTGGPIVVVDNPDDPLIGDTIARLGDLHGAEAEVILACDGVSTTDWDTRFLGVVSRADETEPFVWQLTLAFDDRQLQQNFPPYGTPRYQFEDATEVVVAAVRYGHHASGGVTDFGMAGPTPVADNDGPDFLAGIGRLPITRIYNSDVDVTPLTGSVEFQAPNGIWHTLIEGDELTPPAVATDSICFDTAGVLDAVTTGDPFLVPTSVILHILDNWVFDLYGSQTHWLSGAAPVDATFLAAASTFLSKRGYGIGKSFTEIITAKEVVEGWSYNFQVPVFWTPDGELAFRPLDLTVDPYDSDRFRWDRDSMGEPKIEDPPDEERLTSIHARYCFIEPRNEYAFDITVSDHYSTGDGSAEMELDWSARYLSS